MVDRLLDPWDLTLLVSGRQSNPHGILGIVPETPEQDRIILFRPGAEEVVVEFQGEIQYAHPYHSGVFSLLSLRG